MVPTVPGGHRRLGRDMGWAGVGQLHPRSQGSGAEQEGQRGGWGTEAVEEPHGWAFYRPTPLGRQ